MSSDNGSSGDEDGLNLDSMFPEAERPATPPPKLASYDRPKSKGEIVIRLVAAHPLWAHHLWNASKSFSDYIESNPELYRGRSVLELGAGGGLPGIVCALEGAETTVITDYPDEPLLENIRINVTSAGLDDLPANRRCLVAGHLWGKDCTSLLALLPNPTDRYDLLILSDLIFNHSQHLQLLQSCERTISATGVALVFHSHHLPKFQERDLGFFRLAKERGWEVENVVEEKKWGVMFEEDEGDRRLRETVWGWAMRWTNPAAAEATASDT